MINHSARQRTKGHRCRAGNRTGALCGAHLVLEYLGTVCTYLVPTYLVGTECVSTHIPSLLVSDCIGGNSKEEEEPTSPE